MMSLHKHQICLPIHLLLNLLPQLSDLCQLEVSCQLLLQPQLGPTDVLVYPVPSIIQITLVGDWTFAQCSTTTKYNMSNSYWRRAFRVQKHHPQSTLNSDLILLFIELHKTTNEGYTTKLILLIKLHKTPMKVTPLKLQQYCDTEQVFDIPATKSTHPHILFLVQNRYQI